MDRELIRLEAFEAFIDMAATKRRNGNGACQMDLAKRAEIPTITRDLLPHCSGFMVTIPEYLNIIDATRQSRVCKDKDNNCSPLNDDQQVPEQIIDFNQSFSMQVTYPNISSSPFTLPNFNPSQSNLMKPQSLLKYSLFKSTQPQESPFLPSTNSDQLSRRETNPLTISADQIINITGNTSQIPIRELSSRNARYRQPHSYFVPNHNRNDCNNIDVKERDDNLFAFSTSLNDFSMELDAINCRHRGNDCSFPSTNKMPISFDEFQYEHVPYSVLY